MKDYKYAIKIKTNNTFNYICDLNSKELAIAKMTLELLNSKFKVYLMCDLGKE